MINDKIKKILIVGGTGFLGYHILKKAKKKKISIAAVSLNQNL